MLLVPQLINTAMDAGPAAAIKDSKKDGALDLGEVKVYVYPPFLQDTRIHVLIVSKLDVVFCVYVCAELLMSI